MSKICKDKTSFSEWNKAMLDYTIKHSIPTPITTVKIWCFPEAHDFNTPFNPMMIESILEYKALRENDKDYTFPLFNFEKDFPEYEKMQSKLHNVIGENMFLMKMNQDQFVKYSRYIRMLIKNYRYKQINVDKLAKNESKFDELIPVACEVWDEQGSLPNFMYNFMYNRDIREEDIGKFVEFPVREKFIYDLWIKAKNLPVDDKHGGIWQVKSAIRTFDFEKNRYYATAEYSPSL
jgi:hypothetical protein